MPRQRSPSRDEAKRMYLDSKGKMLLKDIAKAVGKQDTQIRRWKSLDHWDEELKGNVTIPKDNVTKQNNGIEKPPKTELLPEEIETLNNEELTEKQRLFCLYYVRWFNATKAYQKAYSCDYFTAATNGPRLLGNARIKEEIQRIKDAKIKQTMYSTEDYFQKMIDIAYSDVTDYLSFGQEEAQDKNGNTFMMNVINLKESCDVDGTLIQEVKQGKDGIAVKLVSKEFALKWLDKHYSEATDLQKAQIEQLRAQTDKLKADNENAPDDSTQCAMDAITGIVEQMQPLKDDDV
ncbi:terminase small subunit [[Clostridium] innocuum]|uniref:terminase small subunit n=1 Tax=Clostridium innocuum TaxID=1522 RepID=UPI001C24C3FC|nr:terminase small subunit [[Clostridium] innocuum]MBU9108900.1 terminase small subunit [[Clostridium] innocuum]MCR0226150.1 terminase small subunit [[Clostridium] innocuum]MCR0553558.1 terminase small subunit [[Clostridium] innocuum]MCR0609424.1 terminase small subunit [[Clostridium] innocuum]